MKTKQQRLDRRELQLNNLRFIGWRVTEDKANNAVICLIEDEFRGKDRFFVKLFKGSAVKAFSYYQFDSAGERQAYINRTVADFKPKTSRIAGRAAEFFLVGDVLYNSWGWEQTNIDWYQVIEVKKASIVIRQIGSEKTYEHSMAGDCTPVKDSFLDDADPILKRVNAEGRIAAQYGCISKWDGKPKGWTSYA